MVSDVIIIYGPLLISLIITVSLGIYLIKNTSSRIWPFLSPIALFLVYIIIGALIISDPMGSGIFVIGMIFIAIVALIINAIVLGIYLWRHNKNEKSLPIPQSQPTSTL